MPQVFSLPLLALDDDDNDDGGDDVDDEGSFCKMADWQESVKTLTYSGTFFLSKALTITSFPQRSI